MNFREIEPLLVFAAHGLASREELDCLNAALLEDEELRRQAILWLGDESLLRQEAAVLEALHAKDSDKRVLAAPVAGGDASSFGASPTRRHRLAMAIGGVVAACSIALNFALWPPSRHGESGAALASLARGSDVRLVRATGCVWDATSASTPRLGGTLHGGDALKLIEGIGEFQLDGGGVFGSVRLQGPASAVLRADGMPILSRGRMVADVNVYGEPCNIDTPAGLVRVIGNASIGVEVSAEAVSIHVLEGQASLPATGHGSKGYGAGEDYGADGLERPLVLQQGEAVSYRLGARAGARFERIAADPSAFAEEQSMATDRLSLDAGYRRLVLDSNPVGYWRFDEAAGGSLLHNEVAGDLNLRVDGEISPVRQRDNYVLEFGMTRGSGFLVSEQRWPREPLDSCTIEFWFKPSHFHNGALTSLVNPVNSNANRDVHALIVEIGGPHNLRASRTRKNAIRFVTRSPANPGERLGEPCLADQYAVREWQHLALVKQGAALRMHLNGEVVAQGNDDRPIPAGMKMLVGQIYTQRAERRFIGQLDELAVYEHALEGADIVERYRSRGRRRLGGASM